MSNLQVFVEIPGGHKDEVSLTEAKLGENVCDLGTALAVIHGPRGLHGRIAGARESWTTRESYHYHHVFTIGFFFTLSVSNMGRERAQS